MSRARNLGNLGNKNLITGDVNNTRVGIGSTTPDVTLDVVGIVSATSFYDANGLVGGGGGASKVYDSTIFAYQNVVQNDITIASPYLTGTIYCSEDVTVDIESGVTVTVNDGAVLNIIEI
jgi:hypothetical protein